MRNAARRANGIPRPSAQYAALPWRRAHDGGLEILLITTRRTRRWIIPKGWPLAGCLPCECAAQEALEEAGVRGVIAAEPLGAFPYDKNRKSGDLVHCSVQVFPLEVIDQLHDWPEKSVRDVQWCSLDEALTRMGDAGLRRLITKFAGSSGFRRRRSGRQALRVR